MPTTPATKPDEIDSRFTHIVDLDHPASFDPHFADRRQWEKRAAELRRQVQVALGLWPLPERTPLKPIIHGRVDRGDYTIDKVFFASLPGHYVSGLLYRPAKTNGKIPGVLCPHGHWPDGRFTWCSDERVKADIASGAETLEAAARSPNQARCAMLARLGCAAFFYDMVGYADSKPLEHRAGFADAAAALRLQSIMGLQTWNSLRALDFLLSLGDVDEKRLAITGESGGGTQTIALSIVDDRLTAAFPAVMVSVNMQGGCVCENAPLLRVDTNNAEMISLFAPKPLGMSAAKDWTEDLLTRGFPEIRRIYQLYDAADRAEAQLFPFPHGYNQPSREMMYNLMNRALKLGAPSPIKETPTVPLQPAQMSVYDAEHPRPADNADVTSVRRWMTQSSDARLAALARDPAAYAEVVRGALRAMVVDALPASDQVEAVGSSSLPLPGAGHWRGFISRAGRDERVPVAAIFPPNWKGHVVIWSETDASKTLGANPREARELLNAGAAVIAVDLFQSGDFQPPATPPPAPNANAPAPPKYFGLVLGYNRSIMANRVRDLLSVIALARGWSQTREIDLIALGQAGLAALLAKALADDAITRAAIDLNHFDFDQITDVNDPMLLPGALKYGGINGFVPLCAHGQTLLYNARESSDAPKAVQPQRPTGVEIRTAASPNPPSADLVGWLLKK